MKFILKNNQGYALLTVLLTITVFGVLSIALISNSFSSTKQNAMAEKKSQSIELAEMGAKYFEYAVKNAANDLIQSVRTEIETEQRTTGDVANPKEHFTERSIEILIEKLDDEINTVTVPMKNKTNASFTIDQISFVKSETGDELIVTSKSIGNNNGKTSEITASVTISFANFITMVQGANQTPSPTLLVDLPPELTITFPSNIINGCTFTNEFDYSSKTCRDPRDIITGSNFNELKFNESIVKLKSMDVNGNMNFPISESTIYVENNVDFKKSVRFTGSNLFVGSDINFSMSDGLTIENQSNLYVNGFADFNKVVDIKGNSNIYVGNADFKKNTSVNNSFLYVKGNSSEDVKVTFHETLNITNNSRVYVTDDTYLKKGFTLNQSILHIKGYTDVDDAINLNNNAKLCVDGVFDPKHNVNINKDNSSKIYAKSTTYQMDSTIVNTNPNDFEKECSCNAPSSDQTISWGTMDISPKFDYSY